MTSAAAAIFAARAEARALLWRLGELSLHEAVDALQAAAERDGLVAEIGQDMVQEIMARALGAVRDDLPSDQEEVPDDIEPAPRPCTVATSTLDAADYLVRAHDLDRFRKWFSARDAHERAGILRHLESHRRRQAS